MKNPALRSAVAAVLLIGACSVHAESGYWYSGLGAGYSRIQFYTADFSSNGTAAETKKQEDAGFKVFIGNQINRNWGAEVSFVSVGKFSYTLTSGTVSQEAVYKVTGWGVSALPTINFTDNFALFGRIGGFFSQTRTTIRNQGFIVGAVSAGVQSSQVSVLSGVGAQYFFGGDSGVRLEFENFGKVGSECSASNTGCTGRSNARMVSLSAIFAF